VIKIKNKNIFYSVIFLILLTSGLSIGLFFTSPIPIQYTEEYNHPNSSADEFTIITPETKTYTEPMSGYYPATHGFESDGAGDDPLFCTVEEIGGEVNVVDSIGGHNKVVAVIDNSAHLRFLKVMELMNFGSEQQTHRIFKDFVSILDLLSIQM